MSTKKYRLTFNGIKIRPQYGDREHSLKMTNIPYRRGVALVVNDEVIGYLRQDNAEALADFIDLLCEAIGAKEEEER